MYVCLSIKNTMIEIGRFGDFNDSRKRESIAFPSANNMDADTVKLY